MAHFHIEGLAPYDGDHPFELDMDSFTMHEFKTIKDYSGVLPTDMHEAFLKGDMDLVCAFAAIALERAGVLVNKHRLYQAKLGQITFVGDKPEEEKPEVDAGPPEPQRTEPERLVSEDERQSSSGKSSETDGDSSQVVDLRATGSLG